MVNVSKYFLGAGMWHLLAGYIAVALLQHLCSAFGVAVLYLLFLVLTIVTSLPFVSGFIWIGLFSVVVLCCAIKNNYIKIFHNALCTLLCKNRATFGLTYTYLPAWVLNGLEVGHLCILLDIPAGNSNFVIVTISNYKEK